MVRISQKRIFTLLQIVEKGDTLNDRARALEDLICYLFDKVPGISVKKRNPLNVFNSEEIDIAFWNEKKSNGFSFLPNIILVECKNWCNPVGSEEVSWFDTKLRSRGLTFGVLVAINGITGNATSITAAHNIIATALREQRNIIVITRTDIQKLKEITQVVRLLKEKICELAITGTVFP